jgi:acetyl esterase/lipase
LLDMPSLQARVIELLLPLSGFRRLLASEESFRRGLPRISRRGPALPSPRMRRRFAISEREAHGSRVFTVAPRPAAGRSHILFLHGGGYFCDITAAHWSIVGRLIRRTGATVTVPLYPLAPQHNVTDVLALLLPLCRALTAEVGAGSLTLMGDSSGGGISLALAQLLRDRGEPLPASLVLLSPWLDATLSDPSQPGLAGTDRLLAIPGTRVAGAMYAGDLDPADPRVSPLFGSTAGLPPIAVFNGTHDLLHPDGRRLRDKAAREGASLAYYEYAGLFPVWLGVPLPESAQALDEIA